MTPRQKFVCAVLGILVPAIVSLGTVYLNSRQANANAKSALRSYEEAREGRRLRPTPEPVPVAPAMVAPRTDMAAFRDSVEKAVDTTRVIIAQTGLERMIGLKARTIPANQLRKSLARK